MNTKLLNKVAIAILDEPRKFDMGMWVESNVDSPCGTTACIAGHAVAISKQYPSLRKLNKDFWTDKVNIEKEAMEVLGIADEWRSSATLFAVDEWPFDFGSAYDDAETPDDRAEIAFWRIQHFIATDGNE